MKTKLRELSNGQPFCDWLHRVEQHNGYAPDVRHDLVNIVKPIMRSREGPAGQGLAVAVQLYNHLGTKKVDYVIRDMIKGKYTYKLAWEVLSAYLG